MTTDNDESAFVAQVKQTLDRDAAGLDAATQSRLRRARAEAVAALDKRRRPFAWWPAAGALAAGLLVAAVWWGQPGAPELAPDGFSDLDLLADTDNLDFYDDLEFYSWLAADDVAG